jgi:hypothetical protein
MSDDARLYTHPAHPTAAKQARERGLSVVVLGGYVWEHDHDPATGEPTSGLRPHYKKTDEGYPKGGYPDIEAVRAKHLAAKRVPETPEQLRARLVREHADLAREIAKLDERGKR